MAITLDITGFYYQAESGLAGAATVYQVMLDLKGKRAPNGGVLDFREDDGFISEISVYYDGNSDPVSRQANSPFGQRRPVGVYRYADDVMSSANRIESPGAVPGLLAWQYYVMNAAGVVTTIDRVIKPAAGSAPIEDGSRIVWRLVAIFGLNVFIEAERSMLAMASRGEPMSLKKAGRTIENQGRVLNIR